MPNTDDEPLDGSTARSLFDLRLSHQLSSEYAILGDLPLHAKAPSASQPLNQGPLTRVMTWNVGGGAGTLDSPDKLSFVCRTMLCQGVQIAANGERPRVVSCARGTLPSAYCAHRHVWVLVCHHGEPLQSAATGALGACRALHTSK